MAVAGLLSLLAACGAEQDASNGAAPAGGAGEEARAEAREEPEAREEEAEARGEAEAEVLRVAEETINGNFAANRVEPFVPHIAGEVTAFGPFDRALVRGKDDFLAGLREAVRGKTTHRWEERDWVVQLYGDVAVVSFLYDHDATRGGRRARNAYRATYVLHRRDGRWVLVHDHTSSIPSGPGG